MHKYSILRSMIRNTLVESMEDVVEVLIKIRIKSSQRSVGDILTDVRGIKNVITVSQQGTSSIAEDGKMRLILSIKFEDDESMSLEDLKAEIKMIPEIDMLTVQSFGGQEIGRTS